MLDAFRVLFLRKLMPAELCYASEGRQFLFHRSSSVELIIYGMSGNEPVVTFIHSEDNDGDLHETGREILSYTPDGFLKERKSYVPGKYISADWVVHNPPGCFLGHRIPDAA
jgi:hypothetical protein